MDSDKVLVMSQGKVAEYDTPTNLLANEVSEIWVEGVVSGKRDADGLCSRPSSDRWSRRRVWARRKLQISMQKSVSDLPQYTQKIGSANGEQRVAHKLRWRSESSRRKLERPGRDGSGHFWS